MNIVGYQGLSRFVQDFPRFNQAIESYVTADYNRENLDATWDCVPGLRFLLFFHEFPPAFAIQCNSDLAVVQAKMGSIEGPIIKIRNYQKKKTLVQKLHSAHVYEAKH